MKVKKINQTLGELETEVMEIVWQLNDVSVRQVLNRLRKKVFYYHDENDESELNIFRD